MWQIKKNPWDSPSSNPWWSSLWSRFHVDRRAICSDLIRAIYSHQISQVLSWRQKDSPLVGAPQEGSGGERRLALSAARARKQEGPLGWGGG